VNPALTSVRAIGVPIAPSPMNPTFINLTPFLEAMGNEF